MFQNKIKKVRAPVKLMSIFETCETTDESDSVVQSCSLFRITLCKQTHETPFCTSNWPAGNLQPCNGSNGTV